MDYNLITESFYKQLENYILIHNIKGIAIGESGGLDSAINTIICSRVCQKLNIPLIGVYIGIESNKEEEKNRAEAIGNLFCTEFHSVDLTKEYIALRDACEMFNPIEGEPTFEDKIRRGNIKARMRMIYIRDIAQRIHGITIDNTNRTEFELGFFTKNDGQDLSPLFELWKTEEYELAKYLLLTMKNEKEKKALQDCIDAVPTDGLGITDSDLEQMGCDSYEEVDDILRTLINAYTPPFGNERLFKIAYDKLIMKYSVMKVDAVWCRHVKSEFKRKGLITLKFNRYIC